jgi:hypothetical protein
MGINLLVDFGDCVEQAPRCSWLKLRVTGLAPFVENIRNLCRGNRSSIQGSDNDVVGPLVVELDFIVTANAIIETLKLTSKLSNGSCCQMTQITLGIPSVFACDLNLTTEG